MLDDIKNSPMRLGCFALAGLLLACDGSSAGPEPKARATATPAAGAAEDPTPPKPGAPESPTIAAADAKVGTSPPSPTCVGLDRRTCVMRSGCILDQPAAGEYVCRDASDACERAVLHGAIIGPVPQTGVTSTTTQDAIAACNREPGCTSAGGDCSCPCAVLGSCRCGCGGRLLARCVRTENAAAMNATPSKFPPYR